MLREDLVGFLTEIEKQGMRPNIVVQAPKEQMRMIVSAFARAVGLPVEAITDDPGRRVGVFMGAITFRPLD
jgi:hypothetical protein